MGTVRERVRAVRPLINRGGLIALALVDGASFAGIIPWLPVQIHSLAVAALILEWLERRFQGTVTAYRMGHMAGRLDQQQECRSHAAYSPLRAVGHDVAMAAQTRRRIPRPSRSSTWSAVTTQPLPLVAGESEPTNVVPIIRGSARR